MQVEEPRQAWILVHDPDDVLNLRLGGWALSVVDLASSVIGCSSAEIGALVEESLVVPSKVKVAIQVNACATATVRITVLAPARVTLLVVVDAIWVDQRQDCDSSRQSSLDLGVCVGLWAILETGAGFVGSQQVSQEIDDIVRSSTLSSMDTTLKEDAWAAAIGDTSHRTSVISLARSREGLELRVSLDESSQSRGDLVDVEDGTEAAVLDTDTLGSDGTVLETISGSNGVTVTAKLTLLKVHLIDDTAIKGALLLGANFLGQKACLGREGRGEESESRSRLHLHCL